MTIPSQETSLATMFADVRAGKPDGSRMLREIFEPGTLYLASKRSIRDPKRWVANTLGEIEDLIRSGAIADPEELASSIRSRIISNADPNSMAAARASSHSVSQMAVAIQALKPLDGELMKRVYVDEESRESVAMTLGLTSEELQQKLHDLRTQMLEEMGQLKLPKKLPTRLIHRLAELTRAS
jgi:hypothetical protein